MVQNVCDIGRKLRLAIFGGVALAAICLGCSGCGHWNLRGDGWEDNSLSAGFRKVRPPAKESDFGCFSNKAREIEADCGTP